MFHGFLLKSSKLEPNRSKVQQYYLQSFRYFALKHGNSECSSFSTERRPDSKYWFRGFQRLFFPHNKRKSRLVEWSSSLYYHLIQIQLLSKFMMESHIPGLELGINELTKRPYYYIKNRNTACRHKPYELFCDIDRRRNRTEHRITRWKQFWKDTTRNANQL